MGKVPDKLNNVLDLDYDKNIGNEFNILFVGDTNFAESYLNSYVSRKDIGFNVLERYGHDYFFQKVKPILFDSDLVISNLETPLIDVNNTVKPSFSFSSRFNKKQGRFQHWSDKTKTVEYLKKYNILNVSLANNHMLDYGIDGLHQTLDKLKESGIRYFGAGVNRRQAGTPYTKDIFVGDTKVKLAVISAFEYRKGYDMDFSFYASDMKAGVNRLSLNRIQQQIKKLREDNNNVFVVAFPHWGGRRNYGWRTDKQVEIGHQLVDAGADIVIGGGPHNFQEIEEYNGRLILYSIGNFIYNTLGNYDNYNVSPFSLAVRLVFQINNIKNPPNPPEQDNDDNYISLTKVKKILKVYPIMTDNLLIKWQARFLEEKEFKIAHDLLIDKNSFLKSSKRPTKAGIDKIGRFVEVQLDWWR
jgi:hypothetical protein